MIQDKIRTEGIYTKKFFNFISKIRVNPQNIIIENFLDKGFPKLSSYYTPRRELSELAIHTLEEVQRGKIIHSKGKTDPRTIPGMVFNTGVLREYPELTMYFRIVLLETFSVVYAIKYREDFRQYLNGEDIRGVRDNINFIVDILGFDPRYKDLILSLQTVEIELAYIQAQVNKMGGSQWLDT